MKKRRNPTEILENSKNPHEEKGYVSSPNFIRSHKEIEDISGKNSNESIYFNEDKIKRLVQENEKFYTLHTHPLSEDEINNYSAMPSRDDLYNFLRRASEGTMRIAQQDPRTGKIAGYIFIRKTKQTPILPKWDPESIKTYDDQKKLVEKHPELKKFIDDLKLYKNSLDPRNNLEPEENYGDRIQKAFNQFSEEYSLQIKYVPVKGYAFRKGRGFSKKNDLEHKVTMTMAILSVVAGVFFLSPYLTGAVMGVLNQESSTIFGGVLFILGLLGLFITLRY